MDTKIALAIVAVLSAALLATVAYGFSDAARWVYRRSTAVVRATAKFIVAPCARPLWVPLQAGSALAANWDKRVLR